MAGEQVGDLRARGGVTEGMDWRDFESFLTGELIRVSALPSGERATCLISRLATYDGLITSEDAAAALRSMDDLLSRACSAPLPAATGPGRSRRSWRTSAGPASMSPMR